MFWAGLASVAYLPSTVIPTGPDASGLPIGVQIIGPEYGDLVTIGVAKLLEQAGFGFIPAPNYSQCSALTPRKGVASRRRLSPQPKPPYHSVGLLAAKYDQREPAGGN